MRTLLSIFGVEPRRIGGTEMFARELSQQLGQVGWKSVLCFLFEPTGEVRRFMELPNVSFAALPKSTNGDKQARANLNNLLQQFRPDILHLHYVSFVSWYPWTARLRSVPQIFFTDHHSRPDGYVPQRAPIWKRSAARIILHPLTKVICVSNYGYQCMTAPEFLSRDRFEMIYNGVDLSRVKPDTGAGVAFRKRFSIAEDRKIVTQVSWIIPEKGIADFIEMARQVSAQRDDAHFVLVGDGAQRDQYMKDAAAKGLADRITWTGTIDDPFGEGVFAAADVVCQFSRWEEVFGWMIAEAMAHGKPVVATRVGGIPELIVEGKSGFLVDRGNTQAMSRRVLEVLNDDDARVRMGNLGREIVQTKFDLSKNVSQLIRSYGIAGYEESEVIRNDLTGAQPSRLPFDHASEDACAPVEATLALQSKRRLRSSRSDACASDRKPASFRSLFFPQAVFACLRQEPRQDLRPLSCPWPANASPESMSAIARKIYQPIAIAAALGFVYFTVLAKLGSDWWHDENYSHGLLIPFVIAFIMWQERSRFANLSAKPAAWLGAIGVAISTLMLWAGTAGAELFVQRISLVLMLASVVVYFFGVRLMRFVAVPLFLLLLSIPIPQIVFNKIAFPLQLFASRCAVAAMSFFSIPVLRQGNVIELMPLGATEPKKLAVVEACSGIRSLMTLVTLAVIYAYFTTPKVAQTSVSDSSVQSRKASQTKVYATFVFWRSVILVLSAVPIAILTNAVRVSGTGVLAHYYGTRVADGFFHSFSGWVVYIAAALLLFATGWVLDRVAGLWLRTMRPANENEESAQRTIENSPPIHRWETSRG